MEKYQKVPKRVASVILQSLKAGVVPRIGLPYITVGRKQEIETFVHDADIIQEGGASFRFIEGKYGAGKSFLLQAVRNYVMDKGFIVADADLSPERRFQGNKGQGLATYRELIRNLAVKSKPEGGALNLILDRWILKLQNAEVERLNCDEEQLQVEEAVSKKILSIGDELSQMVYGFDFSKMLQQYYIAYRHDDYVLKDNVTRWFRGEYVSKADIKKELKINTMINDDNWYEFIKLFASFFRYADYTGMMIMIDELVNLYKIPNAISRQYNYEKILMMYNDILQGKAQYLGVIMCGTPQSIQDERRGLYSYEALRSRLSHGKFSKEGRRDLFAPIIHLDPLKPEELFILCEKLSLIHSDFYSYTNKFTQDDIQKFIQLEYDRVGAINHLTPREVIRDFIELADILYQNPDESFSDFVQNEPDFFADTDTNLVMIEV